MSRFASRARELEECIHAWTLQLPAVRGAALVDESGLVLVSTLNARGLEEGLAAFAASALASTARAERDFGTGPPIFLHLSGRDRQLYLVPVATDVTLLAIADPGASTPAVTVRLLALAREIVERTQPEITT